MTDLSYSFSVESSIDARTAAARDAQFRGFEDWPDAQRFSMRASSRLARHIPARLCVMRNAEPIASFTFDDAPANSFSNGGALLEDIGARATYYVATALMGKRSEHWINADADLIRAAHRSGHEIALHGHLHAPAASHDAAGFLRDLQLNRDILRDIDPTIDPQNYAYPFGHVSLPRKFQLAAKVRSARTILRGVNCGAIDPAYLRSVELADARIDRRAVDLLLDAAMQRRGWISFLSHDVSPTPSPFGVTPDLIAYARDGALRRGFRIATIREALDLARLRVDAR
jgi:peptidoglycan/xylan/chitin deacetylase (PgdA/CDA1 family)